MRRYFFACLVAFAPGAALAGPPYVTDDPEPTGFRHFEIYAFTAGATARDDVAGETGIDFNYGAAPDLQTGFTATVAYDDPRSGHAVSGIGNIRLSAKYRFLHQEDFGWDVSVFPQVSLPSVSPRVGEQHASVFLPVWVGKDWDDWSTFGGGGCALDKGDGAEDWCLMGWALTRQVTASLDLGVEIYRQTPDARGGKVATGAGAGVIYDLGKTYHVVASFGPGLQNAAETGRLSWYVGLLTTF